MNSTINIIDRDFNFLGQIDNYEAFISTKKWHSIGGFELHLHEDTQYADKLQKENIIFTTPNKAYVILYREVNSINEKLVVKGLEIKSYLARWLVFPPTGQAYYRINSNVETIMKEYVQATLNRKDIANFIVAPNQNRGIKTVYQSRYKNLADELEKLSLTCGLGWDITLDIENKRFVFDVFEGQDRTAGQDMLPPAIFSLEYDNIAEQTLIESKMNYANVAVVAGQGEGTDRVITIVGDAVGLDSFELFVDARDIENAEDLPERGLQKLSEVQKIFNFDSRVLTNKNLRYEEDFNLGDIITIQNKKWNITTDRRITEVTEIYESDGFKLDIVFGENIPTIKDIIKQATDTPIAETSKGEPGEPGQDGVGLQFTWDGTSLGVKREDETEYQFVDLQGPRGEQGEQGPHGKSLEFHWNGTQLGVRVEGQTQYQYVDLKGPQGERGPRGFSLEYDWQGTQLGIKREGESNYQYVDLRGPKGDKGDPGSDANVTYENVTNALGYTPVNKAGDTMTGSLVLTGSIFDTEFKADNWNLINKYTGGGWARGLLNVKNKDGTNYIQIGGFGSGQNFTRLYIGKAWNDWLLGVNPNNNTVEIQGNLIKNNKEVATKDEIPTKLSELMKDIDFDERYYTETEIDNFLDNHINNTSNPHSVTKSQVGLGNVQNYGIATQAEAEAGSINNKYMTPLRTRQAIEKVMSTIGGGTKIITSPTEPTGLTTGDQWHREI